MKAGNIGTLVIGSLLLGCLLAAQPSVPGQAAAQWAVGDSWRVSAWHAQAFRPDKKASKGVYKLKGRLIGVFFQVSDITTVDSAECYEVQVTFPKEETGFQRLYRAYYSRATGRLVRIKDVSVRPDGTTKDSTTDYPADAQGPTFVDDTPCPLPLDWPDLTQQNVTTPPGKAGSAAQTTAPGKVPSLDGAADEVTLTKSSAKKETKVVQHWRKGEPWWRLARKYEDGQLVAEAMLLEHNGRKIADAPKEAQ